MDGKQEQMKQELLQAVRFCLDKNLFLPGELEKAKKSNNFKELALIAVLRMELYQKAHPENLDQGDAVQ